MERKISDRERWRREKIVLEAFASVSLSGFKTNKEQKAHAQRFINGEIDLAEFLQFNIEAK